MRKTAILLSFLLIASSVQAAVTVNTAPTSLVTTATTLAPSTAKAIFEFALTGDASETLTSVAVTVNSATAVAADLASVAVYRDDGDGSFDAGDFLAGSNTTVNVGSTTTVNATANNTLTGAKFFVVLTTSASWSGTDSATVTFNLDGIVASASSPTNSAVTTAAMTMTVADTTGPALQTAAAVGITSGTAAKEAGDTVVLTFNEATNKAAITVANIDSVLVLNNSHSWLDGATSIGGASWDTAGMVLTVTFSAATSVPTVAIGDSVTVSGSVIKDAANNDATGSQPITGSFGAIVTPPSDDDDFGKTCDGGIINGRLYKVGDATTVYLAAACRLKPFRGSAVFHARGYKFQNIITLSSVPSTVAVSDEPALPAGGTLVKGTDPTVWFVTSHGKRKGFVSENSFRRLGFSFGSVKKISDSDLATMLEDTAVTENSDHPEGSIIKCGTSTTIFEVKNNSRFPFTNPNAFLDRGHSWDVISVVDCGRFAYLQGNNVE